MVTIIVWLEKIITGKFSVNELIMICLQSALKIFSMGYHLIFFVTRGFICSYYKKYNGSIYALKQLRINRL